MAVKIMMDVEKRQAQIERHALKMLMKRDPHSNLPMIPQPESAHFRKICYGCSQPFWDVQHEEYCESCRHTQEMVREVNNHIANLRAQVDQVVAQARVDKMRKMQREGASNEAVLAAFYKEGEYDDEGPW